MRIALVLACLVAAAAAQPVLPLANGTVPGQGTTSAVTAAPEVELSPIGKHSWNRGSGYEMQ